MRSSPQDTRSRLDPEPVWMTGISMLFAFVGALRLPRAAVLDSPSKRVRVSLPETLAPGAPFVPLGRSMAVFKDSEGVFAISTVCTHLGCIVRPTADGFECPCHGSRFAPDGSVTRGPAPQPLRWLRVSGSGSDWVVDEAAVVPPGTKVNA
jgi:cytochrome b6-f complex iron-sulfur subunit